MPDILLEKAILATGATEIDFKVKLFLPFTFEQINTKQPDRARTYTVAHVVDDSKTALFEGGKWTEAQE